ncbi:MAG: hypothetical protein IPN95_06450 [Bacteroidetes bacterium]|nr:hypothetical protein [Bacteroidota bacterium]
MTKSKLLHLMFSFTWVVVALPIMLNAQRYEVKTRLTNVYFDDEPRHLFKVDLRPHSFNVWLAEQVEHKQLKLYTDEQLTSPLPMDTFYELFFSQLFSEEYHWNATAHDDASLHGADAKQVIPAPAYWKQRIATSHSIQSALQGTPDLPTTLLWQTHSQSVFLQEDWQINGNKLAIAPEKTMCIQFLNALEDDTIGEVFLRIDPAKLPAQQFGISNNFTFLQHASNQQVFDKGLYGRSIVSYRTAGEEVWPVLKYEDPFATELMAHLEAQWDAALPKLKWNMRTIPGMKLACLTSAGDPLADIFFQQGYSFQDTAELSVNREFGTEIVWPLLLEVLKGKRKAYDPARFSRRYLPLVPGTDFLASHKAIIGELTYAWMDDFDDYYEDDGAADEIPADPYAYLDTLAPTSAIPEAFRCYLDLFYVVGTCERKGKRVSFHPENIWVIWKDPTNTLPTRDFCVIPLENISGTFRGQTVPEYLATRSYPHVLTAANRYSFLIKYAGIWLEKVIQSAEWDKIPDYAALNHALKMDDIQWLEFLKALQ